MTNTVYGPILIVEDVPNVLELLEVTLRFKGYSVITAHNGEEALEVIEKTRPVLIITDILMPKMDGYTFVRRLKKNPATKDLPLVVLTSYEPMKDMFQMEGVNDYFVKSASMEGLFKVLNARLNTPPPSGV